MSEQIIRVFLHEARGISPRVLDDKALRVMPHGLGHFVLGQNDVGSLIAGAPEGTMLFVESFIDGVCGTADSADLEPLRAEGL